MRIEYQGTIEAQPPFQHVGYISAFPVHGSVQASGPFHMLYALAAAGAIAVALIAGRRERTRKAAIAGAFAVLCAMGVGAFLGAFPDQAMTPQFQRTLFDLEHLSAQTEAWAQQHGRLPTPDEWHAAIGSHMPRDERGPMYRYEVQEHASGRDGQHYRVLRTPLAQSQLLGPDGLFGTADDAGSLKQTMRRLTPWEPRPAHGRTARTCTYPPPALAAARAAGRAGDA